MGRYGARQASKAAKARLSGAIPSNSPKNKKISFGKDDDELESMIDEGENVVHTVDAGIGDTVDEDIDGKVDGNDEDDDDAVEEVAGSAARESIQRQRDEERKVVKDATSKKKRRKKDDVVGDQLESKKNKESQSDDENEDEEEEEEEIVFTDNFFKMVDSERAVQLQKAKKERKHTKMLQQKMLGKHTTFVVEDDYEMLGASHKVEQNIEVVALGGSGDDETSTYVLSERQLIISATLGSAPSKAAVAFARGSMACGTTKERSSESRKRKSKDEETWKRSRKLNRMGIGSRPGQAATLFVCKKK